VNCKELIKKSKKGDIDIVKNTKETLKEIKDINKDHNYFLTIDEEYSVKEAKRISKLGKGRLFGVPFSIKDAICVKDMESKAGSKILEGYSPVFDATVVEKIKSEGGIIVGKTNQDVFGFGSFNVNVGIGNKAPLNPFDKKRTTGGSSGGGSGIAQKISRPLVSITESTGGSIVAPASYCGVYGLCPTYGRISRYGLITYSNSMDKIGVTSKNIEDVALVMEVISGHDERDSTSIKKDVPKFTKQVSDKFKIALVKESIGKGVQDGVKTNLMKSIEKLKYDLVSLPLTFGISVQDYYLISMSEVSTNLSNLCGLRYGVQEKPTGMNFNEYFSIIRSKNFTKEAKRRIILGTYARMSGFRDAYYLKALKVRTKIIEEYKNIFKKYDLIVTPTMPNIAPKFTEIDKMTPLENYMMDIMTAGPNLAGFPHLNIPNGLSKKMPTGMLVIANHFEEQKLLDFARSLV
jgi:aspartyl-tRNA(Asn)/glutamyl-tRNA(Gln) amidotransferase subunit A